MPDHVVCTTADKDQWHCEVERGRAVPFTAHVDYVSVFTGITGSLRASPGKGGKRARIKFRVKNGKRCAVEQWSGRTALFCDHTGDRA